MHPTDCGEVLGFAGSLSALCRAQSSCIQGFARAPRGWQRAAGTHITSKQAVSSGSTAAAVAVPSWVNCSLQTSW